MSDQPPKSDVLLEQQLKFCINILNKLKRNQNAGPFLKPVDAVALGIPDYYEKIKEPMDISTIRKKLENGEYKSPDEFDGDMKLMFNNCYTYNTSESVVYEMGLDLQKVYEGYYKEMPQEVVKKAKTVVSPKVTEKVKKTVKDVMGEDDYSYCGEVLAELEKARHRRYTWPFMQPVTERDAPGYFDVVKNPMDISTIKRKFESGGYGTAQEFNDDIELMIENCYKFNAPETEVYNCCKEFEKTVGGLMAKQRDPETRINELRKKINVLSAELREAERQKSQTKRVYSLGERERLGQAILKLTRLQIEQVAEIFQRHCAYEYIDNDDIEVNLNTISDEVLNEVSEYISKVDNGEVKEQSKYGM
ncbi:hypothetical protein PAEPH01_2060 [Pancytospora epiphaga]|nr:hypothetical protein PAEPH01_2060 [Pancytospora epiphaga]